MPTPGGSGKQATIQHEITKVNGVYQAVGSWVNRIGGNSGNQITWLLKNTAGHPITIRIHKFSPSNPCPVTFSGSSNCWDEKTAVQNNATAAFHAHTGQPGNYTYEILVSGEGSSNAIDPELQIDGHSFRKKVVIIGIGVAVALAVVYFVVRSLTR